MGHYDDFCPRCGKHEDDCVCPPSPETLAAIRQRKWDTRFLKLAGEVAEWSKDPSTKVGAVIYRPDLTIVSLGFNGFPRGVDDDPALYADRSIKYERVIHAELNAILTARGELGREYPGITGHRGGHSIATTLFPCSRCAGAIIQAGLSRVVTWKLPPTPDTERLEKAACWGDSRAMLRQAKIEVVEIEQ